MDLSKEVQAVFNAVAALNHKVYEGAKTQEPMTITSEALTSGQNAEKAAVIARVDNMRGATAAEDANPNYNPLVEAQAPAPQTQAQAPAPQTQAQAPAPQTQAQAPAPQTQAQAPAPQTQAQAPVQEDPLKLRGLCEKLHGLGENVKHLNKEALVELAKDANIIFPPKTRVTTMIKKVAEMQSRIENGLHPNPDKNTKLADIFGGIPSSAPAPTPVQAQMDFTQQGQYPQAQGQYPLAQGQYPQGPPAQGQYPPAQGQYPPAQGQYAPPPAQGQYAPPPAQGQYAPPPAYDGPTAEQPSGMMVQRLVEDLVLADVSEKDIGQELIRASGTMFVKEIKELDPATIKKTYDALVAFKAQRGVA